MMASTKETACDWTVSGMDCGSCAAKIRDAVTRMPGVSGVEVSIMSERLRLTLDEAQTGRDKIEKTVRALGYQIAPRAAGIDVLAGRKIETAEAPDGQAQGHRHLDEQLVGRRTRHVGPPAHSA